MLTFAKWEKLNLSRSRSRFLIESSCDFISWTKSSRPSWYRYSSRQVWNSTSACRNSETACSTSKLLTSDTWTNGSALSSMLFNNLHYLRFKKTYKYWKEVVKRMITITFSDPPYNFEKNCKVNFAYEFLEECHCRSYYKVKIH